ncbi:MAG TPA: DUF1566 domain-containing protein [Dissulfurispiraceae bacterium]|nr:DUF1566 domain-containing protein [Dissulfurispiraceae bacterium]
MKFKRMAIGMPVLLIIIFAAFVSPISADDARFTIKDGVITDARTGLQWVSAPERPMNHYQAEQYARSLTIAGGGWRLPALAEVKGICDDRQPGGADPKFRINGHLVWVSEIVDVRYAGLVRFGSGCADSAAARDTLLDYLRVLAVRVKR